MRQDGTLIIFLPVRPLRINGCLKRYQTYVWYQNYISLAENRLVGKIQFGITGRNIL